MMGERTSVHSTWRPGTFVVCLWPVTCSHKMCWSRGIMMRKAQPVLGTPRLSSCEKSPGEAWTLSRQQMVTRFFRLKLSRAVHRRIYTMGRLRNCPRLLVILGSAEGMFMRRFRKMERTTRGLHWKTRTESQHGLSCRRLWMDTGWAARFPSQCPGYPDTRFCMRTFLRREQAVLRPHCSLPRLHLLVL